MTKRQYHSWMAADTQDNSKATATRSAPSGGLAHFITSVSGSFDGTAADKALVLKDGSTEVGRWTVPDQAAFALSFLSPVKLSPATAANLELDASGAGGTSGTAVMTGYTL